MADDWLVNKLGDVCIGLEVEKPELFTLGESDYEVLHQAFVKAIKVLPAGSVVHVQDIYRRDRFRPADQLKDAGFLEGASDRFSAASRI